MLKNICQKSAAKMDTVFALVVGIENFINCLAADAVVLDVNIAFMTSREDGLITGVSHVFSGFH